MKLLLAKLERFSCSMLSTFSETASSSCLSATLATPEYGSLARLALAGRPGVAPWGGGRGWGGGFGKVERIVHSGIFEIIIRSFRVKRGVFELHC